jgi:hypothetical protein
MGAPVCACGDLVCVVVMHAGLKLGTYIWTLRNFIGSKGGRILSTLIRLLGESAKGGRIA